MKSDDLQKPEMKEHTSNISEKITQILLNLNQLMSIKPLLYVIRGLFLHHVHCDAQGITQFKCSQKFSKVSIVAYNSFHSLFLDLNFNMR